MAASVSSVPSPKAVYYNAVSIIQCGLSEKVETARQESARLVF